MLCILLIALSKISQMLTAENTMEICFTSWLSWRCGIWSWKARLIRQPAFTMQVLLFICEHSKVMNCLIQRSHVESMFLYSLFYMLSQLLWHWNTVVIPRWFMQGTRLSTHTDPFSDFSFQEGSSNTSSKFGWNISPNNSGIKNSTDRLPCMLNFYGMTVKTVYKNCQPLVGCNR